MKGSRRNSRSLVVKGLYHWHINASSLDHIFDALSAEDEYQKADLSYARKILGLAISNADKYFESLKSSFDRPLDQVSPIEKSILLIAMAELDTDSDVPYKVVINESVELAKSFGGTDGYKYVNGVIDRYLKGVRQ